MRGALHLERGNSLHLKARNEICSPWFSSLTSDVVRCLAKTENGPATHNQDQIAATAS